jgi:hypothetical protein
MRQITLKNFGASLGQSTGVTSNPPKSQKTKALRDITRSTQQFLDAGQKVMGSIRCKTCQMVYTPGTEDDLLHTKFCGRQHARPLTFAIAKDHRIISEDDDGAIVMIDRGNKTADLKKVAFIRAEVERLQRQAPATDWTLTHEKAFLYISQKKVIGFALAEQIDKARPVDADQEAEEVPSVKAVCGMIHLWASPSGRAGTVRKALLTAAREQVLYGYSVPLEQVAYLHMGDDLRKWAASVHQKLLCYRH